VGVTVLADIRPSEWELPLFVHVLGGMALVGALVLAATYLVPAWRGGAVEPLRNGFRTLLYAALPSFLVLRISAEWLADEEGYADLPDEAIPDWIDLGYIISDAGGLFLIIALIVSGVAVRRTRDPGADGPGTSVRVTTVLVSILLVAYLVAIWAMTTRPG
jgi:uncharacterized membrane protein